MTTSILKASILAERFTYLDYIVFGMMLLSSAAIGVFYGCFGKKMRDTKEFLMAGKSMTTFPVAMSLLGSFMSAITLLGTPSETYQNGISYSLTALAFFLVIPSAAYLYLPVFWNLQVTSAYEYLELRFNKAVRRLGSLLFILQTILYMSIVVYAPSLALAQVMGLNVYLSVSLICFVCIFYTTLGGMKAVLWTDALQVGFMYVTMIFIIVKGTIDQGGFAEVWKVATASGRTDLQWDLNPGVRHTCLNLVIGGYFSWITIYGVNQSQVQRYLCVRKKQTAVKALWINCVGLFILVTLCGFGGLVIYTKYQDCDPIRYGVVSKGDQLLPLFVMDTLGSLSGLPGLFVAGIFSGALSTVSSGLNSLAAIALEDFVKDAWFPGLSESKATTISRILSCLFGLVCFAFVFIAERLGNVITATVSVIGMAGGPLIGAFTLGMFFPWANSIGAFAGMITSLILLFWIGIGCQVALAFKKIIHTPKPTTVAGCLNFTEVISYNDVPDIYMPEWTLKMYSLSYMWYAATGCFVVIIVGLLVTAVTGWQDPRKLNPKVISPGVYWLKKFIPGAKHIGAEFVEENAELQDKTVAALDGITNFQFVPDITDSSSGNCNTHIESSHMNNCPSKGCDVSTCAHK